MGVFAWDVEVILYIYIFRQCELIHAAAAFIIVDVFTYTQLTFFTSIEAKIKSLTPTNSWYTLKNSV